MNERGKKFLADGLVILGLTILYAGGLFVGYTYAYNDFPTTLDYMRFHLSSDLYTNLTLNGIDPNPQSEMGSIPFTVFYWFEPAIAILTVVCLSFANRLKRGSI